MSELPIGTVIGAYRLLSKLGQGAMGVVYRAQATSGRQVALKVIHPELATSSDMVSRFFTEARAASQLGHPNIIHVIDFGQTPDGDNFIAMELLEGLSLGDRLKQDARLPLQTGLHLARQIAEGLAVAHSRGIIHRDLKPDNVFLVERGGDREFVKILDFGLAKMVTGGGKGALMHQTAHGSAVGTPHYMAPEQCAGRLDVDHRVDVYALGCLLFQMLCGETVFPVDGFGEVIVSHIQVPPRAPRSLNPLISIAVEKVILRALAKPREDRFQSMNDFLLALKDPDRWARATTGNFSSAATFQLDDVMKRPLPQPAWPERKPTPTPARVPVAVPKVDDSAATLKGSLSDLEEGIARAAAKVRADEAADDASVRRPTPTPSSLAATMQREAPNVRGTGQHPVFGVTFDAEQDRPVSVLDGRKSARGGGGTTWIIAALVAAVAIGGGALVLRGSGKKTVLVSSQPDGAEVLRDGQSLGKTPLSVELAGGAAASVLLHKDGYVDVRQRLDPGEPQVNVALSPLAPPAPPPVAAPGQPAVAPVAAPPNAAPQPATPPTEAPAAPPPHKPHPHHTSPPALPRLPHLPGT